MSNQTAPPSLGAQWKVSLAEITAFPVPKSGMPTVGSYTELGCTRNLDFKWPSQKVKQIRCKLNPAEWTVPGDKEAGVFSVDSLDFPTVQTDIISFLNKRCVVKLETLDEEDAVARTISLIDWSPALDTKAPQDGDGETIHTASGPYQRTVVAYT